MRRSSGSPPIGLFFCFLCLAPPLAAAPAAELMTLLPDEGLSRSSFVGAMAEAAGESPAENPPEGGRTVALVRLDAEVLAGDPDRLSIPLPDGRVLTAFRSGDTRRDGHLSWSGELQREISAALPAAPGFVHFYQAGGQLFGTLQTEDGAYFELSPEGENHRLVRYPAGGGDPCGLGPGAHDLARPVETEGTATTENICSVPGSETTITVMVLYPRSFSTSLGNLTTYVNAKIGQANDLFAWSDVKIEYQLTHIGMITGNQPPDPEPYEAGADATGPVRDWLNTQFATAPVDTEVEILRQAYGADMVMVVVNPYSGVNCGIANLPVTHNGQVRLNDTDDLYAGKAFAVVEYNCGNGDFTFAHELGHTLGMWHDTQRSRILYPWAYGFLLTRPSTTTKLATVMGCTPGFNDCSRIPRFSNPDQTYTEAGWTGSVAIGLHSGPAALAGKRPSHNACVGNLRANATANFADAPQSAPPSVTITSPAHGATVGTSISLTGTASDPQDGNLTSSIQWTSNRQGALGTGSPRAVNFTYFGKHLITATVTDANSTKMSQSVEIRVTESAAPQRWIDYPAHNQQVTGIYTVVGWALDQSGVPNPPTFQVDGQTVTLTNVQRTSRGDVCAAYPLVTDPNCPMVGWQGDLDTSQLPHGSHTLTMTARDLFNNAGAVSRTFRTQNPPYTAYFPVSEDAWVSEADPAINYGTDTQLQMRASGSGFARHAYLKVVVAAVTRSVISAGLVLRTGGTAWPELNIYRLATTTWNESTINWSTGPLDPLYYLQLGPQPANDFIYPDITPMVTGNGTYTFGIVTTDHTGHSFFSREANPTYYRPYLEVTY